MDRLSIQVIYFAIDTQGQVVAILVTHKQANLANLETEGENISGNFSFMTDSKALQLNTGTRVKS